MIVTYRVMPADGDIEISELMKLTEETVKAYDESVDIKTVEEEPVGFGLKAVKINFAVEETKGSEDLENELAEKEETGEVTVLEMSRALG